MAKSPCSQLLGEILREADLITDAQIQVALQDQQYSPLPIGEILVVRGWLQQETVDFFAESWPRMVKTRDRRPLGYYLQQAYLLQEDQVNLILEEQRKLGIRFGSVAVLKGWVKQKTLDYFLEHLMPEAKTTSAFQGKNTQANTAPNRDTRLQTETPHATQGADGRPSHTKSTSPGMVTASSRSTHNGRITLNPFGSKTKTHKAKQTNGNSNLITNANREDFDLASVLANGTKSTAEKDWEDCIWID
ncbi:MULTISPECIES: hypothetical protein [unclassified Synechocystis]|uniref:hypothetical protein n=1 Tax=unclassified Synechocystis TaxID=2640012 RepID=UPI000406508F|nr:MULTISPECIES: hypothetical protein [unclassified Synechocystis]AIE74302.1 hypothetical protein D082_17740 [Synechocystis sp. PCC 6714]MCT0254910.1 hypothetical protein [Synechocystis sp. CS-94]